VNNFSDSSGASRASSLLLQPPTRHGAHPSAHTSPAAAPGGAPAALAGHGGSLLQAAAGLRAALEQAGDGLATADLDSLLSSEIALAAALAVLPTERGEADESRDEVLQELARARSALTRCRRLGGALSEMVRITMRTQGRVGAYGPNGRQPAGHAPGALEARG
jgi:hypothetical protein